MNAHIGRISILLLAMITAPLPGQQSDNSPSEKSTHGEPRVSKDTSTKKETLNFPIAGNSIDAESFYQSVLSRLHWTTELTQRVVGELNESNSFAELESAGRISVEALGVLTSLFPAAFEFVEGDSKTADAGSFRVNMAELESKWSEQKLSLRNWLASRSRRPLFEVHSKVGFDGQSERTRIVLVLPGLHGGDSTACEIAAAINQRTGLSTCAFRYPNDAPLAESTDYLIQVLKKWHLEQPNRAITLVAHSMGGMVARNAIERHLINDPSCLGIERLILICPPNQGSIFAQYAGVLEGAEQLQRLLKRGAGRRLLSAVLDGFNEAPSDLVPGSEFLKRLEVAKRHPQMKYSILAGDAGLLDPLLAQVGNEVLELLDRSSRSTQPLQDRARNLLNSEELHKGTGDGVVTLQSARLEGVADFEVLPINHLEWGELDKPSGQRVLDEVVERITMRSF